MPHAILRAEPVVEFNLLSDKRDLDRLMSGFRKMATLQMSAPLQAVTDVPFPASYSDRVRKIGVVNTKNKVITAIAAAMMDGPAALRRYMIDTFIVEGFTFDDVMNDDEALEAFVRKAAIGVWHASCSCRMGRADDPMAVVDTAGPCQRCAGPARGRCLDLPGGAVRQHQFPDADDGGEDRGHHGVVTTGAAQVADGATVFARFVGVLRVVLAAYWYLDTMETMKSRRRFSQDRSSQDKRPAKKRKHHRASES